MASSLCPLPGGLLGGRPNELSSYSPPPAKAFHLSLPDNKATEARQRPLLPAPAGLGFSVSFSVSWSPAPAPWCWPQAACPGVLKAQLPLSTEPGQVRQAAQTPGLREKVEMPTTPPSPESRAAPPGAPLPLKQDLSTGPLSQGSPCAAVPYGRTLLTRTRLGSVSIRMFMRPFIRHLTVSPGLGAGLKKCQHGLSW